MGFLRRADKVAKPPSNPHGYLTLNNDTFSTPFTPLLGPVYAHPGYRSRTPVPGTLGPVRGCRHGRSSLLGTRGDPAGALSPGSRISVLPAWLPFLPGRAWARCLPGSVKPAREEPGNSASTACPNDVVYAGCTMAPVTQGTAPRMSCSATMATAGSVQGQPARRAPHGEGRVHIRKWLRVRVMAGAAICSLVLSLFQPEGAAAGRRP